MSFCLGQSSPQNVADAEDGLSKFDNQDIRFQEITSVKNQARKLFWQRWYAMFVKKILHSKRHKSSIVSQLVMPSIFVLLSLIVVKELPNATVSPALTIGLSMFGKTQTVPFCGTDEMLNCSES